MSHKLIDCILTKTTTTKNYHIVFHLFILLKLLPFNETWQMRLSRRLLFPYHVCLLLSLNKNTSRICFSMAIKIIIANVYLLLFASYRAIILLVQFMNFILCQWSANEFLVRLSMLLLQQLNGCARVFACQIV